MYCPNCGYELDADDVYCPNCSTMVERKGYRQEDAEPEEYDASDGYEEALPAPVVHRTPNAGLAMVVSVILPGIGAVIAGKSLGLAIFALSVVALIVAYSNIILAPFFVSVMIVLWIIGLWMTSEATTVKEEASPCRIERRE